MNIPAHIRWPLFVVALLLLNIGVSVGTFFAAGSDGGVQVEEDYYEKAVAWDDHAARRAASRALGWSADLRVLPAEAATAPLRPVELRVTGRDGTPVEGLRGTITARRPDLAAAVARVPLAAVDGTPGLYRPLLPLGRPGLWDFEVEAERDTVVFLFEKRIELPR